MWGLDFGNPDFVKLSESFGGIGYKVTDKNDYLPTLLKANKQKGLKLIELMFDYPQEIS